MKGMEWVLLLFLIGLLVLCVLIVFEIVFLVKDESLSYRRRKKLLRKLEVKKK